MPNSLQSNYNKKLLMQFTNSFMSELTIAKSVEEAPYSIRATAHQ